MNEALMLTLGLVFLAIAALAAAIAFGGPSAAGAMPSINDPFKSVDLAGMPALSKYQARDGTELAYLRYAPAGNEVKGSVVLVHGSSASSRSMHTMAQAFSQADYEVYALDIRGHGESGQKGTIAYIGQLEDDLEDFSRAIALRKPATLAGFSSGGGFVLRVAGSSRQNLFDSYLLLSPFLSQDAQNYRPNSGGWVRIGLPRILALRILNSLRVSAFNNLKVTNFALSDEAKRFLTPSYSFALAANFRPNTDYKTDLRQVHRPCAVVAGGDDEAFQTDKLEPELRALGVQWPVTIVPSVGHIALTLDPRAVAAAVQAVQKMHG